MKSRSLVKKWHGHGLDSLKDLGTRSDQGETIICVRENITPASGQISKPQRWGERKGISKKDRKQSDAV